jgi:hypothetical protein
VVMDVRKMLPAHKHDHTDRWELTDEHGVAGYLEGWSGPRGGQFYSAVGIHPETGEECPLESSTDMDERIAKVEAFRADPAKFAPVWARPYSGHVDDPNRVVHGRSSARPV